MRAMEEVASSSSAAASSSSPSEAAGSAGEGVAGSAREILQEGQVDRLVAPDRLAHQFRAARYLRPAQLNLLQQQLDAQFVDNMLVNGMAGRLGGAEHNGGEDFVEQVFDVPSSSRSAEFSAVPDVQGSEMQSWFEYSVENLFRSIQPPLLRSGARTSLDMSSEAQLSSGQASDISSNYKRHKVLAFSMHGAKASLGTSFASSSLGPSQTSHERALSPSTVRDVDNEESSEFPSRGEGEDTMESDVPSMYLTDDLLHTVFSFLDQRSLCEAAKVCRQWRTASEHEEFWKCLRFGSKITQDQVVSLCRRFPRAVDLRFTQVSSVDEVAREAMNSLRYLEKLIVRSGTLTDSFFTALANGCPALHHLVLDDVVLGSSSSNEVQIRHKNLVRLQVQECRVMRIGIRCPRLEMLSLRQTNMASANLNCPRILSLDVSSCPKFSDAGVRIAATQCKMLLALNISQCSYVSDETLREICIACSNLQLLDASWCPNISLQGVRMPALRELKLNNCEGINSSSMAALSQCFTLEAITLDTCVLLTAVMLKLQRLHNISLANCHKLVDLTLQCTALVDIDVSDCCTLNRIDISSRALKKLSLQKQQSLTTVALDCPHLQVVNFVECDALANSICEVLSDGGGCPRLNSLTLESCESLSALSLSSIALTTLSLAGCHNLFQVELACANLQQLVLDGCHQLSSVSLAPVGLQSLNLGICPHVTNLKVEASSMVSVDLKGCGSLNKVNIDCPQLMSLDASYCSSLDDECLEAATVACPLIQSLVLACCPLIGPSGLLNLEKLGNLTTLDLSYTFLTDLSPVFESCKRLKVLRLLACKYLADSSLDALYHKDTLPDLRELDLSYGGLGHDALKRVLSKCTYLTHVNFNGCAKLNDLAWLPETAKNWHHEFRVYDSMSMDPMLIGVAGDSLHTMFASVLENTAVQQQMMASPHALQQLNCVGCPNMKRVMILDAIGFQDLTALNFSLSNNLKEAQLECPFLITLNLSHCLSLESLQMKCPRLVSLSLQASNIEASVLGDVLYGCTALETLDIRNCAKISTEDLVSVRAACPRLKRLLSS